VFIQMYSPCVGLSVRIALFIQNGATWKKMVISRIFFLEEKTPEKLLVHLISRIRNGLPKKRNYNIEHRCQKMQIITFSRIREMSLFFVREGGRNSSLGSNPGGVWRLSSRILLFWDRPNLSPLLG